MIRPATEAHKHDFKNLYGLSRNAFEYWNIYSNLSPNYTSMKFFQVGIYISISFPQLWEEPKDQDGNLSNCQVNILDVKHLMKDQV